MTEVRFYSTLSRTVETLQPREVGKVTVYCCGPTVYDVPHAGHARAAVAFDVLVRHLRARGYEVEYVRNDGDVQGGAVEVRVDVTERHRVRVGRAHRSNRGNEQQGCSQSPYAHQKGNGSVQGTGHCTCR